MDASSCQGCREREARIAELEARLWQLEAKLREVEGRNSSNSSKPPSSDGPEVKARPKKKPSQRNRGAQPGHEKKERPLLPPDRTEPVKPSECRHCGEALSGEDPEPLRHQVIELPPIKPDVTEYQLHRLTCSCCGTTTCAPLPDGVPAGQYGPRLQSVLSLLSGAYRLSKRMVETLVEDIFAIPICTGTICNLERQTTAATEPVVQELREYVQTQNGNMDETSWREENQKAWLWVMATACVTVFHIARRRNGAVARFLLGPGFHWVLTSDRYSAYMWLALEHRQICWAHLRRDFQAMIDRGGASTPVGEGLLRWCDELFHEWYRVRDGTITHATFQRRMKVVRLMVQYWLEKGKVCACAKTAGMCKEILRVEPALWTFADVEGIEPTNNAAERALRHAVLWRKSSYGTASKAGSQFVANILSIVATCRQQNRNVLDFLTDCCQTHLQDTKSPSLLPTA